MVFIPKSYKNNEENAEERVKDDPSSPCSNNKNLALSKLSEVGTPVLVLLVIFLGLYLLFDGKRGLQSATRVIT